MSDVHQTVNGFAFLPPKLSAWINTFIPAESYSGTIPFTPLEKPVSECRIAAVTSAGISMKSDPPFDMEREKAEPDWGDPTHRVIPKHAIGSDISVNHLHINTSYISRDINVILPLQRLADLHAQGMIGAVADSHYSFYGFQWKHETYLDTGIAPMITQMKQEGVDAVVLTPA